MHSHIYFDASSGCVTIVHFYISIFCVTDLYMLKVRVIVWQYFLSQVVVVVVVVCVCVY